MIRTGYLRWEVDAHDERSTSDAHAREVALLARPSFRRVLVKNQAHRAAAERFTRGESGYQAVLRIHDRPNTDVELTIPDVGPHVFRYSESDRHETPRFWMEKLQREVSAFAHEVVRTASAFPQLVIESPELRANYARLVETETFRVIEGRSAPAATNDAEPMQLDATAYQSGVPELVAAELVRDVVNKEEFSEFCTFDRITILSDGKYYRIPRRPHALIEVWNAHTLKGEAQLCVIFQDPGMPASDEVVMKYLLAKHQPDVLWKLGVRFTAPKGRFDGAPPRRWS
jgi:hypothetical protein